MKKILPPHRAILLLGTAFAIFTWGSPSPAAETCAALLTDRCESCHYLTRVCEKVAENKGKWSWKRTVKNMVRQGAKLTPAEQDILVTCLSEPAPEAVKLCGQNK